MICKMIRKMRRVRIWGWFCYIYEDAGHLCLYYPKFHCKLNFIKQYWGNTKFQYWETHFTNNEDEMMQNMHECLDSVPVEFI